MTVNKPVIVQVNTYSIITFQDHRLCNLQFHRLRDLHAIQHILCALRTRGYLSLSHRQGYCSLHSNIHSDCTTIEKLGVYTHTPTGFRILGTVQIFPSTDGELKFLAAIPLVIWPQGKSTIRCTNKVVHGTFLGLEIFPSCPLHCFRKFTHSI